MNFWLNVRLRTSPEQARQLALLQQVFVQACNQLAVLAHSKGIWSRIGLHQLGYAEIRRQFPQLGSQMACNVVYSVSRAARWAFHHPDSPVHGRSARDGAVRLMFGANAPVYFDRHTLRVRDGHASMYSLDGRLRFDLPLAPEDEYRLRNGGIREIALIRDAGGLVLRFHFSEPFTSGSGALPVHLLPDGDAGLARASNPCATPTAGPSADSVMSRGAGFGDLGPHAAPSWLQVVAVPTAAASPECGQRTTSPSATTPADAANQPVGAPEMGALPLPTASLISADATSKRASRRVRRDPYHLSQ